MSSKLVAANIIKNFRQGIFQCPYCKGTMALKTKRPLAVEPCEHCRKLVTFPYKIGPFWLFQALGGGGMGMVYKAFHHDHNQVLYAVKVLPRKRRKNSRLIRALQREAHIGARFGTHPNIVSQVSHGWHKDEYFLAMEYVRGLTLDQHLKKSGPLPNDEVIRLGVALLSAIRFILEKGYLYRDLKPQNVLLGSNGGIYLFDFGLCLPRSVAARDLGDLVEVSPIYVPPERLTGEGEDIRSEIYSLGMVLYEAATGHPYFSAQESEALLRSHVSEFRLDKTASRLARLSPELCAVVTRMVKRSPEERFPDIDAVSDVFAGLQKNCSS